MRTKQLFAGLNNRQKIRFMVNGFGMYCRVQDVVNICSKEHRVPVWIALDRLGNENYVNKKLHRPLITGYASTIDGVEVQVDFI
jgi:hypothetical protein